MSDLRLRFKQYQKKVIMKNQEENYVNTVAVGNLLVSLYVCCSLCKALARAPRCDCTWKKRLTEWTVGAAGGGA